MRPVLWMKVLFLLATLLLVSRPPFACAAPPDILAKEPRFAQSVRVEAEGISIRELLAHISEAAKLPLRASREVAEEKIIVFGPPRPMREILQDIAMLLGAEWQERNEKDAPPYYLLEKRSAARERETTLANAVIEQMFQQMEEQVRALRESPEKLARRPEGDPIRYLLSRPDGKARQATEFYASLNRRQRRELFERGQARVFYNYLSAPWQAVSLDILAFWHQEYEKRQSDTFTQFAAIGKPRQTPPDLEIQFDWENYGQASLTFQPNSVTFAHLSAKIPRLPRHGDPFTGEAISADATLPAGPVIETVAADQKTDWITRLRRLSETADVPVVADYYRLRCAPDVSPPEPAPDKLGANALTTLDAFSRPEGRLWWVHGQTLLFRKADWYERRLYEPSDLWLTTVSRDIAARNGWATYADILRLKELTQRQIVGLAALNEDRRGWLPYALAIPTEKLAGISELVNLLRIRAEPTGRATTPLLSCEDRSTAAYNRALVESTLRYTHLTSYQQQLILPFLAAQRESLQGEALEEFFCWITAYAPQLEVRGYQCQRVIIHWQMGRGAREDFEISLPLTLPDDRRDKTRVTVISPLNTTQP